MPDTETGTLRANDVQVGGDHYRKASPTYQHWDWVVLVDMPYLTGCSTKYITRWREKNGTSDLRKAGHYLDKFIEVSHRHAAQRLNLDMGPYHLETDKFVETNALPPVEAEICRLLATWTRVEDLVDARRKIDALIASETPVTVL